MTEITKEPFGITREGRAVTRYTMRSAAGMLVRVLDYGCTIQSVIVPDRNGRPVDVVLGYDELTGYEQGSNLFGAVVGRYANRIRGAVFTLDGREYALPKNDGGNHLHGTFDRRVFDAAEAEGALVLRYVSPDGEEGFPGTLSLTVTYSLKEDGSLVLDYRAVTDRQTILNLTNHSYFNLSGEGSGDILDQRLRLNASRFTEIGAGTIPTGRILSTEGTALDFREEKSIGRDIGADEEQMRLAGGYDHNLIAEPGVPLRGEAICPVCSSIRPTPFIRTLRRSARTAFGMRSTRVSAWRVSTGRAAPPSRIFQRPFCVPGRSFTRARPTASAFDEPVCGP